MPVLPLAGKIPRNHGGLTNASAGRIVERPEDALAILDRQGDDHGLAFDGVLENSRGGLIDEVRQLADEVGADWNPREPHRSEAT